MDAHQIPFVAIKSYSTGAPTILSPRKLRSPSLRQRAFEFFSLVSRNRTRLQTKVSYKTLEQDGPLRLETSLKTRSSLGSQGTYRLNITVFRVEHLSINTANRTRQKALPLNGPSSLLLRHRFESSTQRTLSAPVGSFDPGLPRRSESGKITRSA